jgi:hypothetical protein
VTKFDPLGEIPVGKITNMVYGRFKNTMLPGRVVARAWNPVRFARHAFFSTDMAVTLLEQFDPENARRAKTARDFAKRL